MTNKELFRQQLIESLRRELVGSEWVAESAEQPADVLQESPVQRYSAGVLFPPRQPIIEVEDIAEEDADSLDDEPLENPGAEAVCFEDQAPEIQRDSLQADKFSDVCDETVRLANEYFPAAIGLTFIADVPGQGLLVRARA
ncbi:MAG: hypothetical protein V3T83_01570, partial [Acidobacteriota bacterium]